MKKKITFFQSIDFKIIFVFIILLLVALELIGTYFVRQLETQLVTNFQEEKRLQVGFLENTIQPILIDDETTEDSEEIGNLIKDFSGNGVLEVQVIDDQHYLLGTSDSTQQNSVGSKTNDNDVHQALLLGNTVTSQYKDQTTNDRIWKLVSPIISGDGSNEILGVVALTTNIESVYQQISEITVIFLNSSLIAVALTVILSLFISRAITKPITEMTQQTIQMADGDYSGQVKVYSKDELGILSMAINDLSTKVEEAQETTESERRRLNSVLTHMTDGVIATDRRGIIVIINDKAMEMLNISQEMALGVSILKVLKIDQEYTLRKLLENEDEMQFDFSTDEVPVTLRGEFTLIQRETGFISGIVCVLHDVTKQEKIENERKEFVSNVSHELRTPLTSMRSYLEALLDGAWKDPEIAPQFLQVTQEETDRMIRMIKDLLDLSRMDSGRAVLDLEYLNVNELFDHVIKRFEMMIQSSDKQSKAFSIKREFTERQLWVEVDADKMIQVLDNIMNNAIKYSPDGGTIKCGLVETNDSVVLSISDEGLGIPKRDLTNVFDRFFRVDKARARSMGGTGLGLAISKEVVQQHKGKIWVESTEGKGTTFYISLPYLPYEEDDWE
ncbi:MULTISPECIES: cell wall metabolism sensor histidine kinase WalK [Carnobacterium]|uniref:histidine kinase n=1 Tax=Carnobacterium inhibens TaxID=147709 RepID=A0ABR7TCU8_9LACT|nr:MULTISPECIES: cell wall metabolism sensor histidine kinase WalK [Carnobacterium]MBC9825570.1 cell wall metabolism sensor histidine kinase WalK [Carnobacterium inhibens]MCM3513121.1 cell wall metabolism sensor histidine kinase WalK [Carnobacterium inhibens]MDN5371866.1 two-component system, OmpR family, sensor histidine kinase VicK [Carnobacterium sp.]